MEALSFHTAQSTRPETSDLCRRSPNTRFTCEQNGKTLTEMQFHGLLADL
jgi:GMP synthase-like glutamine amidotransferase